MSELEYIPPFPNLQVREGGNWSLVLAGRKVGLGQPGKISKKKLEFAKHLRKRMTVAEKVLWHELRTNKLDGFHFRRQQVVLGFIVDFFCYKESLIIEVDGEIHEYHKDYDQEREKILIQKGFQILRFTNHEVISDLEKVKERIREELT